MYKLIIFALAFISMDAIVPRSCRSSNGPAYPWEEDWVDSLETEDEVTEEDTIELDSAEQVSPI